MSVWTHINGNIRIDCPTICGMSDIEHPKEKECRYLILTDQIKQILGPQSLEERSIEDEDKNEGEYLVPKGSEGTISYHVYPELRYTDPCDYCPKGDCECRHINISFGGDLRDYDERDTVLAEHWFENLITKLNKKYYIRQAICEIDCVCSKERIILSKGADSGAYVDRVTIPKE